jgi:phosphatidate cytidylyltransferase
MGDWTPADRKFSELPARLASALVLIPAALAMIWYGSWWLAIGCALFAGIMLWEYCTISATPHRGMLATGGGIFGLSLAFGTYFLPLILMICMVFFAALASRRSKLGSFVGAFGVIYVCAMVGSLYGVREGPWDGRALSLYVMSFVWASDAAAYFGGRALGGPRLLPSESPNKTWMGAISGITACAICGYFAAQIEQSNTALWVFAGIFVSIVAQTGDLFESGLKRRFKVKDSGRILPGHGGLLDRVDGLGAVAIVVFAIFLILPQLAAVLGF